jgi:hypothetical protein
VEVINIKNIGFPVSDDLYLKLKIICLQEGKTLKEHMTQLVEKDVKEQENKQK